MSDYVRSKFSPPGSQGNEGSSQLSNGKKTAGDRTRRSWSDREEATLLVLLRELVAGGWKADNGFRSGYLMKLEDALKQSFPGAGIKGTPHIQSKITIWKKNYNSLTTILGRSGVGFNLNGDHKIDCDDEQWSQIAKLDANARFMRNKAWPYFEQWVEIFGKDRANGARAEDVMDAVNALCSEEQVNSTPSLEDFVATDPVLKQPTADCAEESTCQSAKVSVGGSGSKKKRKRGEATDGLLDLLGKMNEATNARLECLSMRIGYEFDLSKARKEVFDLLGTFPELSMEQKFDAGEIILDKVERLDFFMGLPDCARLPYVKRALEKYRPT